MSSYEEQIIKLLQKGKYKFEREKHFSDLKKGKYRFDFYVDGGRAIVEVNGEGHYSYVPNFYHSRAEFESAKERDRRKISYCLAKNIPLYIIPYWEIDNLKSSADIFKLEFLAKTRWKNDQDWQRYQNLTERFKIWYNKRERKDKYIIYKELICV